MNYPKICRALT